MDIVDQNAVKIACAVGVAACIYLDVEKDKNDKHKLRRIQIAADALDRTVPYSTFYALHQAKPSGQPDAFFLLEHLNHLALPAPESWPAYKVKPRDWGEYTRVMRGLEVLLRTDLQQPDGSKAARHDVLGLLTFISRIHSRLSAAMVAHLQALTERLAQTC